MEGYSRTSHGPRVDGAWVRSGGTGLLFLHPGVDLLLGNTEFAQMADGAAGRLTGAGTDLQSFFPDLYGFITIDVGLFPFQQFLVKIPQVVGSPAVQ